MIVNGGFETGNLTGWSSSGIAAAHDTARTGAWTALVGTTTPTNGDSSITQVFTVPVGGGTLRFWYRPRCTGGVANDWTTATLTNLVTSATTTILAPTCTNTTTWQPVVVALGAHAGAAVRLTLVNHDDNAATTANRTRFDDVSVS